MRRLFAAAVTPMTSTDQFDRGDGNRSISPIALQEEMRVLMGVDDGRETKRRRVETEGKSASWPDGEDIFEGATWVTANARWEFDGQMRCMDMEIGSQA